MDSMLSLLIDVLRDLARQRVLPSDIAEMELAAETEIDALAIDSVGKLNLLAEIEERADMAISEGALQGRRTLGELAAALTELRV
jgi:acyl carrier protein